MTKALRQDLYRGAFYLFYIVLIIFVASNHIINI